MELAICSNCSAFISRRYFSIHRKRCTKQHDTVAIGVPLFLDQLSQKHKGLSQNFLTKVLAKLRNDEL